MVRNKVTETNTFLDKPKTIESIKEEKQTTLGKSSTTIKIIDFGTRTQVKSLKSKYFDMPTEEYFDSPIGGGIRSLYYLAQAALKQALEIVIPPTIILRTDHHNMFVYTKAATK